MAIRMKIAGAVHIFGFVVAAGFAAVVLTSVIALNQLKVGGPLFDRIVLGKDLIADILPPPEYLIESYLEATLVLNDPTSLDSHKKRLAQLHKDYDDRLAYWLGQEFDPTIKRKITVESATGVARFWNLTEGKFLPGLATGDMEAAKHAYADMTAIYAAHRAIIDDIVTSSNLMNAQVEASAADKNSFYASLLWTVAIVVLTIVVGGVIGIALGVIRPITRMTEAMQTLAGGNLDVAIPGVGRGDEIGSMAGAMNVFKQNGIEAQRLRAEQEGAKLQAEAARRRTMNQMADRFESTVGSVLDAVTDSAGKLQATAEMLSTSAEETSRQSVAVATASAQTTQNVQAVASATEELSASITEINLQVSESTRIVRDAVGQSNDTNNKVRELASAAQKIGVVVEMISEIAGQTNLLALNATIEAARAGDAGKGFAVVASEVKALATQTSRATEEISGQVRAIQDASDGSARAIGDITRTIGQVSEIATAIASAVEEQGAATQEISRNIQEAAHGTSKVAINIEEVTHATRQTGLAASDLVASADELAKNGSLLKSQVDDFLREVRA